MLSQPAEPRFTFNYCSQQAARVNRHKKHFLFLPRAVCPCTTHTAGTEVLSSVPPVPFLQSHSPSIAGIRQGESPPQYLPPSTTSPAHGQGERGCRAPGPYERHVLHSKARAAGAPSRLQRLGDSRRAPHGAGTPEIWDPWAAGGGQHRSALRCGQDGFVWRWGTVQDASPSLQRNPSLGGRSRSEHPLVVLPCFNQSPAAPERARQRLHGAIHGELGLRFQPVLLISPGDVHGAGTTPDLLLYHTPRSHKVSAARTAHTSGSFGSSSGSPRAGAGNISPLPPHARSWPPLGAAASVGTAFFGVSCPKAACPYTLQSPGETKPTENFPTGRRRDASSSGNGKSPTTAWHL